MEEEVEIQGFPRTDKDSEIAEIEGRVEFDGLGLKGGFSGKVGGDELANFGRDLGDMAAGAVGGAYWPVFFRGLL